MNSTTSKIIVGAIIVIGIGGFVYYSSSQSSGTTPVATTPTTTSTGTTTASGTYKDGTYTGTTASSEYGDVQVSATISAGKLSDITFITMPSEQGHTAQVTASSEPVLKSEAIASQSANVNIISGATQTTQAFEQSLQSALSQAQA
jgi:uncharacterized protein with FMN-binding domain